MSKLKLTFFLLTALNAQDSFPVNSQDKPREPTLSAPYHDLSPTQLLQFFAHSSIKPESETEELASFSPYSETETQTRTELFKKIKIVVVEINGDSEWTDKECYDKGLTWSKMGTSTISGSSSSSGAAKVGCRSCNPFSGDTYCYNKKPVLCVKPTKITTENKIGSVDKSESAKKTVSFDYYDSYAEVEMRVSSPVRGCYLRSRKYADGLCKAEFGEAWKMADFDEGKWTDEEGRILNGGFAFSGSVAEGDLLEKYKGRFWVAAEGIKANCWK